MINTAPTDAKNSTVFWKKSKNGKAKYNKTNAKRGNIKTKTAEIMPKIVKIGIVHKTKAFVIIEKSEQFPKLEIRMGKVAIWAAIVIMKTSLNLFINRLKRDGM